MNGLALFAIASACVLLIGLLSFAMMFQDVAPSQNSYWWPVLIPAGLIGLLLSLVGAAVGALT